MNPTLTHQPLPSLKNFHLPDDSTRVTVGETPLMAVPRLASALSIPVELHLKVEGKNPTGSHKDRAAYSLALDAYSRGYETIAAATCGNFGEAVAWAAHLFGLKTEIWIPSSYHPKNLEKMVAVGEVELKRCPGSYEDIVHRLSYNISLRNRLHANRGCEDFVYDANPGGPFRELHYAGYGTIALECCYQLAGMNGGFSALAPDVVAVPVGNGTALSGIAAGFESLYRTYDIGRLPAMIAASSIESNAIVTSYRQLRNVVAELDPSDIPDIEELEPLVSSGPVDGTTALRAIRKSNGSAYDFDVPRLDEIQELILQTTGVRVTEAAASSVAALVDHYRHLVEAGTPPPLSSVWIAVVTSEPE